MSQSIQTMYLSLIIWLLLSKLRYLAGGEDDDEDDEDDDKNTSDVTDDDEEVNLLTDEDIDDDTYKAQVEKIQRQTAAGRRTFLVSPGAFLKKIKPISLRSLSVEIHKGWRIKRARRRTVPHETINNSFLSPLFLCVRLTMS